MSSPEAFPAQSLHPVLSAAAMRAADRYTIETLGIPGVTLMEVAGRAVVSAIEERYGRMAGRQVVLLCGKGNNGGDGFVVARGLYAAGAHVRVVVLGDPEEHSDDAAHNLRLLLDLSEHDSGGRLAILRTSSPDQLQRLSADDVCVDALLGTGASSDLRDPIVSFVEWMNAQTAPTVSIDLPTGLHTDRGRTLGSAVHADLTVAMAAFKPGLLLDEGPRYAGTVKVAEIGIPAHSLMAATEDPGCALLTTDAAVQAVLPVRSAAAHKYSVGLALVVGGSPGLTGAPVMASTAAARVGAGAVVCACHAGIQSLLAAKFTEVMTLALPGTDVGAIDPDGALEALSPRLDQARALLVGCGLGRLPETAEFVRRLCAHVEHPLVIDADGLNALAGHEKLIQSRSRGRWILTPHDGEFERLSNSANLDDRIEAAREWSARWNVVLVLKGMPTLIGTPNGRVYISGTGNAALATAGTGDVLAGMAVGLLAQGLSPEQAAVTAVHLGGAAADSYVRMRSARTMIASHLIELLPRMLRRRFSD